MLEWRGRICALLAGTQLLPLEGEGSLLANSRWHGLAQPILPGACTHPPPPRESTRPSFSATSSLSYLPRQRYPWLCVMPHPHTRCGFIPGTRLHQGKITSTGTFMELLTTIHLLGCQFWTSGKGMFVFMCQTYIYVYYLTARI